MFIVTPRAPIVVSADQLQMLLKMVGPSHVEVTPETSAAKAETPKTEMPAVAPVKRERKPKPEAAVVAPTGKKRGRKSNAEKAAVAAALAELVAETVPELAEEADVESVVEGKSSKKMDPQPANADDLLNRFSTLIDKNFEAAKGVLDSFGIGKFSELKESDYGNFGVKLEELEV